jgi:hypothetical protein
MDFSLVVVRSFGTYRPGDAILDTASQQQVLGGEHALCVVRVTQPKAAPAVQANPTQTQEG